MLLVSSAVGVDESKHCCLLLQRENYVTIQWTGGSLLFACLVEVNRRSGGIDTIVDSAVF